MQLGSVTATEMAEIDSLAVGPLGLAAAGLLELAASGVATAARQLLGSVTGQAVLVLTGSGGNGLDAVATTRRLAGWGALPTIILAKPRETLPPDLQAALASAEHFNVRIFEPGALLPAATLIIDGLVGYRLAGPLNPEVAELVTAAMRLKVPTLAIDVPSGLDATTGKADGPAIRADVTVTLGYPKSGLVKPFAKNLVGQLLVADLSLPRALWQRRGLVPPDFSNAPLLKLERSGPLVQ